jgi:tetratricopeptide (TPR) repeat protein
LGKDLKDDKEFQEKMKDPVFKSSIEGDSARETKEFPLEAKISVLVFLLGVFAVMILGIVFPLNKAYFTDTLHISMEKNIQLIMLCVVLVNVLLAKVKAPDIAKSSIFRAGTEAVVSIFGVVWMSNTSIQANQSVLLKQVGDDLQIDRRFSIKHFELGDLYFRYRRFDEAIEEYSKAIALDPDQIEMRVKRAKAFAKKGYITRAIQDLQQLKVERPNDLTVRIQLGLLHYSQGNVLDAELEWESVLEIDPVNREAIAYIDMVRKN